MNLNTEESLVKEQFFLFLIFKDSMFGKNFPPISDSMNSLIQNSEYPKIQDFLWMTQCAKYLEN